MKRLLLFTLLLLSSCDKLFPVDTGTSTGRGVVRRVDYEHHMLTVDHELIPRLLQPMTFAYPVRKDTLMAGILPQDTVTFTLTEPQPGSFVIQTLTKVGSPKLRTVPIFTTEHYPSSAASASAKTGAAPKRKSAPSSKPKSAPSSKPKAAPSSKPKSAPSKPTIKKDSLATRSKAPSPVQ